MISGGTVSYLQRVPECPRLAEDPGQERQLNGRLRCTAVGRGPADMVFVTTLRPRYTCTPLGNIPQTCRSAPRTINNAGRGQQLSDK